MLLEPMLFRLSKMYTHYHWKQIIRYSQSWLYVRFFFLPESASFAYRKGSTKRQCTIIKQAFIKNYNDIVDKYNSVSSPEIEAERLKKIKKKRDNSFLSLTATPINFTKTFSKHLLAKAEGNTRGKQKLR